MAQLLHLMVDIRFEDQFAEPIPLAELRMVPILEDMTLLFKEMRFSIMPVTAREFDIIVEMGNPRRTFAKSLIN